MTTIHGKGRSTLADRLRLIAETESTSDEWAEIELASNNGTRRVHRCRPPICVECRAAIGREMSQEETRESRSGVHTGSILIHWSE